MSSKKQKDWKLEEKCLHFWADYRLCDEPLKRKRVMDSGFHTARLVNFVETHVKEVKKEHKAEIAKLKTLLSKKRNECKELKQALGID